MGGGKSKEVIQKSVEKTTQVFSKLPTEKSSAFLAETGNQISPEILKEIEKWSSVKKKQANPILSDEAKDWQSKVPAVPSASLIRIEQDKVLDKVWIENKRIEGKLSEEQLISVLTRLRDNPDQLSLVSTETKISEVQLQLLIKSIRIPRFTKDSDESSPLRIAS